MGKLLSVGLDVGTTTTQLILSELTVENKGNAFSVPEMVIGERKICYQSPVIFTPLICNQLVDGEKVIIIEDVMTSGKALREILPKLEAAAKVKVVGMIISVDRMEKALDSDMSAVMSAKKEFGVDVYSVVTMDDIIAAIEKGVVDGKEHLDAMYAYRATYGAK